MTIGGWLLFIFLAVVIVVFGIVISFDFNGSTASVITLFISGLLIVGLYIGMNWFFQNTAVGRRALVDQQSNIENGLERTVTVYTADGEVMAKYTGKIDIQGNDGGYVLFDYEGKRYAYYNCFVESIAEIG